MDLKMKSSSADIDPLEGVEDESEKSMSLMGGIAAGSGLPDAETDYGSMRGASRLTSKGTLLMVGAFIVAAGALYAMRLSTGSLLDKSDAKVQTQIETLLAQVTNPSRIDPNSALHPERMNALFRDTDQIINTFQVDPTQRQVPIGMIQRNPFLLPAPPKPAVVPVATVKPRDDAELKRAAELLKRELKELRLDSVMMGSRPLAMISGQVAQPGTVIGKFTVKSIQTNAVVLTRDGQEYTITMETAGGR